MTIKTNNHWRPFLYRYEVPPEILASEFDWTDEDDVDGYFQYRGRWYHLDCFVLVGSYAPKEFREWHGYLNDSFFSGILIKLSDDGEMYKIATFY